LRLFQTTTVRDEFILKKNFTMRAGWGTVLESKLMEAYQEKKLKKVKKRR
jgi:hypothetical protein